MWVEAPKSSVRQASFPGRGGNPRGPGIPSGDKSWEGGELGAPGVGGGGRRSQT